MYSALLIQVSRFEIIDGMRTDNGVPSASTGLRLGIHHQRIRPASPQENAVHEWIRLTLQNELKPPPEANLP